MRRAILATVLILSGLATPARSDLIIRIDDQTIEEGGTATVDVTIESTGSDLLNGFGFDFLITPTGAGGVDFQTPQVNSESSDPDYVFFGNSQDATFGIPPDISTVDRFVNGDGTVDGADVVVTGPRLLARLDLTAAAGSAGQIFTISLQDLGFTFFVNGPPTAFNDVPFTSVSGTITVTPSVAVPEASTLTSALLASAALSGVLYKRGRRARPRPA